MHLVVPQMFYNKDSFGIKLPTKVDMLLNKGTKPKQTGRMIPYILAYMH